MKYLLAAINAKYIHSNLGVYCLKAYAEQELSDLAPEISIGEYTINHSRQQILADIYEKRPDVVGFSCYIWNIEYVTGLLQDLPKILPETRIWLGGPEVSYNSKELLQQFPQVTGIMAGEGEEIFARLVLHYEKIRAGSGKEGDGLEEIPGIGYRLAKRGVEEIRINPRPLPMDLNRIPFPYNNMKEEDFAHRIIYYESSRGCPYSCSYCLSSIERAVRFRNLKGVKEELQFFLDRKVSQVKFVDRTFNCSKPHAMEIWNYIWQHDNGVTNFHFEIAADCLDEETVLLLRRMRPGLIQLEIGIQSTNPKTIEAIRRKMDLDQVKRMVAKVRAGRNIHQHLDLIAGLPFEDFEQFCHSFDQVYRMKPDQLQLGFLKVLKGSYMEEQKRSYDLQAGELPPYEVLSTKWISFQDILRLKQIEEMVEVYYNSGQFIQTITHLEMLFSRPIQLFEALADWYQKQNLSEVGHSRQKRYEIMFQWIQAQFPEETETLRDTLTMDLYLRDNVKSRPAFARNLKNWRDQIRLFYQKEQKEEKFLKGYQGFDSKQLANMTHIEVTKDKKAFLFDYKNRDPLNHNAAVFEICLPG